jgi:hypothetical protein
MISSYLDGYSICKLWYCGNNLLNFRIKHGGVRKFEVLIHIPTKFEWPPLVQHLDLLESLSIISSSDYYGPKVLHIPSLPTTLRSIKINLPSDFALLPHFSTLLSLRLPNSYYLNQQELDNLPLTLTQLRVTVQNPASNNTLHITLPQLAKLTITPQYSYHLLTCHFEFPEQLKILKYNASQSTTKFDFNDLPNLTHLHVPSLPFTIYWLEKLPYKLKSLTCTLSILDEASSSALPRYLEYLDIRSYTDGTIGDSVISALPRTLISLTLPKTMLIEQGSTHFLPPSLTHLDADFHSDDPTISFGGRPNLAKLHLPNTLNTLSATGARIILEGGPSALILPNLEVLNTSVRCDAFDFLALQRESPLAASETNLLSLRLPTSLTVLSLRLENATILALIIPPKLRALELGYDTERTQNEKAFPSGWSQSLPPTITSMELELPIYAVNNDWIDHMNLPELKTLTIRNHSFSFDRLMRLPTSLEYLSVRFKGKVDWNGMNLQHMRSLRTLMVWCPEHTNEPTGWIDILPHRLINISMFRNNENPSNTELKHIFSAAGIKSTILEPFNIG